MQRLAFIVLFLAPLACGGAAKKKTQNVEPAALSERTYTHYLRGQLAFFQGDYGRAERELALAKREAPGEAPISRALAVAHYRAGNRSAAEAEMEWALGQWPKNAAVWVERGNLHLSARAFSEAARAFKKAIKLGARDEDTYLSYSQALLETGDGARAQAAYRKLIAKHSGSAEAHYQLALLLYDDKQHQEAIKHVEEATATAPYDLRAWALQASILRALGRNDDADDALRRPFDRSQGNPNVGEQLFVSLLELDQREQALVLVKILDRDDLALDTRIGMGHWLLRGGDFSGALKVTQRLDGAKPSTAAVAELRARALRALHRDDEAIVQLEAITEAQPGYPLMRAMLAELLANAGKSERADEVVESALAKHPDHPDLVMAKATVLEATGHAAEAREILSGAVARHPNAPRPLFALAEVESRRGRTREAIATISPLLQANPRSFAALNYIGYSLIEDPASRERSQDLLLRALELAPDSAFVLDSYGWFLLQNGQRGKAAPLLERAVRLTPTEPELLTHLAELRWLQGQQSEAQTLLDRATQLALLPHLRRSVERVRIRLSQQMPPGQP